jgi:hypothetical protein
MEFISQDRTRLLDLSQTTRSDWSVVVGWAREPSTKAILFFTIKAIDMDQLHAM